MKQPSVDRKKQDLLKDVYNAYTQKSSLVLPNLTRGPPANKVKLPNIKVSDDQRTATTLDTGAAGGGQVGLQI